MGSGRSGQLHAANVAGSTEAELSWVADPAVGNAASVAARFGGVATDAPERAIASGEADAVIVASPTPTHVQMIESCIDAGIPVLCEKPIDLDIARVDALRAKVSTSSVAVAIGFNQRFDPAFSQVRQRVAAGEIGPIEHLHIVSRDPGPPHADYIAVSGGIFRDMTIHDFDLARYFLGDVVEVSAVGAQLFDPGARDQGDFDTVSVTLRAESGALATIVNSRHSAIGYDQRLEASGPGGLLQVHNAPSSLVSASTRAGVETKARYIEPFLQRYSEAYALELTAFIALVRGETSSSPTFEDGRSALIIADAAQRSAEAGVTIRL